MSTTRPRLEHTIATLKRVGRASDGDLWRDVATRLEKPRRTHAEVNLGRIERYAGDGETIAVPGKVLGSGVIDRGLTIAAVDFSGSAERKIRAADGEPIGLAEAAERSPDGSNVRVIG